MPWIMEDEKGPNSPEESRYEAWNKICFALVATVIVCHADTGLDKIEFMMGSWLPLVTAVALIIRLPLRWAIDEERCSHPILHWIGIAAASAMTVFAINLRS